MAHALNLTLKIKQDPETLQNLAAIAANFATKIQPKIDAALRKSEIVHFARVLVIDNRYLQVITEYDGPHEDYTEFFRREAAGCFCNTVFARGECASTGSHARPTGLLELLEGSASTFAGGLGGQRLRWER
jgi:hypothetical protein